LKRAKKVILISASYKRRVVEQSSLQPIRQDLEKKLMVIPNGVDPFWITHTVTQKRDKQDATFNLLYIGKFAPGKNVLQLQEAIKLLGKRKNVKLHLHLVGGGGRDE